MTDVKTSGRRAKAQATRERLVSAAREELLTHGYAGATMAGVARRAGLAVQTTYFVFHTKAALMSAVIDAAVLGPGAPTRPEDTPWWNAMIGATSPASSLESFVRGAGDVLQRAALVSELVRAAAHADEEVRATIAYHDGLQREAYALVIATIATKGRLIGDMDQARATVILLLLCGDAVYVELTARHGWSHAQTVDWLVATTRTALLPPADGGAGEVTRRPN